MATLEVLAAEVPSSGRVLVMPAEPELLRELFMAGYSNLYALSPERGVYDGPFNTTVRYVYGDAVRTHLPTNFFRCVIVGGPDPSEGIMREADRLIANDGMVLSGGRAEKKHQRLETHEVAEVDILLYSSGHGGITEYTGVMRDRLESEFALRTRIVGRREDVKAAHVVVQFENGLPRARELIDDALSLADEGRRVHFEVHAAFSDHGGWNAYLPQIERRTTMLYRANEVAEADRVGEYTLVPHLSYKNVAAPPPASVHELKLGTFGFASRGKKQDELILTARRLGIPLKLLLSVNTEVSPKATAEMNIYISELKRLAGEGCEIRDGFFAPEEILRELSGCSHLIFTTRNALSNSGSIQLGKRLGKPILSLRSFQAQQAQVHQFDTLVDKSTALRREIAFAFAWMRYIAAERPEVLAHMIRTLSSRDGSRRALSMGRRVLLDARATLGMKSTPISRSFIGKHTGLSRDEDGLEYLVHVFRYGPASYRPGSMGTEGAHTAPQQRQD